MMRWAKGLVGAGALLAVTAAHAGQIQVAATPGVGLVAEANDGQCSLREAILLANGTPAIADCSISADGRSSLSVHLPAAAVFTVADAPYPGNGSNGLPVLTGGFSIEGHGATILRGAGQTTLGFRFFYLAPGANVTLRGLTLSGARNDDPVGGSNTYGGAIFNAGTLRLEHCTVQDNAAGNGDSVLDTAGGAGGAIYSSGTLHIVDSVLRNNHAGDGASGMSPGMTPGNGGSGGAIMSTGTLTLQRTTVDGNSAGAGGEAFNPGSGPPPAAGADGHGGGIYASGPTIIKDSAIIGNRTGEGPGSGGYGGGLYLATSSTNSCQVTSATDNCAVVRTTLAHNVVAADGLGSALYVAGDGEMLLQTATVANNSASGATDAGAIAMDATPVLTFNYVTVSANSGGGLRVNSDVELRHSVVAAQTLGADCLGTEQPFGVRASMDSDGSCQFDTAYNLPSGDPKLGPLADHGGYGQTMMPQAGSPLIDTGVPGHCRYPLIEGFEDLIDQRRRLRPSGAVCDTGAVERPVSCYVDASAGAAGDGSSWASAFVNLQDALLAGCSDIRVAQGVYLPSASNDPDETFHVAPGMYLYGGYPPGGGSNNARDPSAYPTELSGDLGGDDDVDGSIVGNNSYRVMQIDGDYRDEPADTLIDGFRITGGNANEFEGTTRGAGLLCNGNVGYCNPRLVRLIFAFNHATGDGGAIYNNGYYGVASPSLDQVTFHHNSASAGGAMINRGTEGESNPSLRNVTFVANAAAEGGGAIYNEAILDGVSNPTLTNVTFWNNSSSTAAGSMLSVATDDGKSRPRLTNVIIWGGTAPTLGNEDGASALIAHSIVEGSDAGNGNWNSAFGFDLGGNLDSDPQLGMLANHGGSVPTLLPGPASPALDAGNDELCPQHDARGMDRPLAGHCDIGATEVYRTVTWRALGQDHQHALTGEPFAWPLVVQALDGNGQAVAGVQVQVQVPASGASALCSTSPTDASGISRTYCTANASMGSYAVSITATGYGEVSLSRTFTLHNDYNDRIFRNGFEGSARPTGSQP